MKTKKLIPFFAAAAIILTACNPPKTEPLKTTGTALPPLKDTINVKDAKRLVDNFKPRSAKLNRGQLVMPDTRSVWFSIQQLKSLVKQVDSIEHGDGIRFYFAAYDKTPIKGTVNVKPEYWDYSTLIMVSTRKRDGDSLHHYDYYTAPQKLVNGHNVSDVNHGGVIIMSVPQNQGELCPPPANCNSIGATLLTN